MGCSMVELIDNASKLYFFRKKNIVVLDGFWQFPAKTEQAAYESVMNSNQYQKDVLYVAFPWATLIDGLRNGKQGIEYLAIELNFLTNFIRKHKFQKVITVCQHILFKDFAIFFERVGVTTVYWSHKLIAENKIFNLEIKSFPLYPAQTSNLIPQLLDYSLNEYMEILNKRKTKYISNFIGAYNAKIYLSDVRQKIFDDANKEKGYLVIERKEWHFERIVYEKQIRGVSEQVSQLLIEESRKDEYINAIVNSDFTLCPTGSGPNSIRIYECLCLGSIPVIITDQLELSGSQSLWQKACIIVNDSSEGYLHAKKIIKSMSHTQKIEKKLAGLELLREVAPQNYCNLVMGD